MTRENELQDLRHAAECEMSRLHFTLGYFEKYYGDVIAENNNEEERLFNYCNTMKHLIMETYDKLVKIQNCADVICRGE